MYERDYGRLGRIGLVTPQANPTAEPEIRLLLPAGVSMHTSRCTSRAEPRKRFVDYFYGLGDTVDTFDTLRLDALAFACTASSYLIGEAEESRATDDLEKRYGYPIITAAAAIRRALRFLDADSIALACPYPEWLFIKAREYWKNSGFRLERASSLQPGMGDTRAIYEISGSRAASALIEEMNGTGADVIVITGTGMPGLQAIVDLQASTGKPVVSSNLCLAWACLRSAGIALGQRAPTGAFPLLGGWQDEVRSL